MASPMFSVPKHMSIPVNEDGYGPVDEKDADRWVCWCGDDACTEVSKAGCMDSIFAVLLSIMSVFQPKDLL